nr:uncharacterized protein LOC129271292 [Lytechinus pictus]
MGHLHTALITYCSCEPPPVTLVRFGLWPCSPKMPATAVSMELMDIVYCMMMEGQISLKAVCQAIGNHSCLDPNEVNLLYRCMVGECMEQFRFFRHMIRTLGDVEQEINCMECPACPQNGPVFISLDANFGLVRKKSSGQSYHPPNHATDLFVGDDEVHTFVEEYDGNAHKDCSNFQAGNAVRTKNQSNKLDITGVFGAACRHGIPLLFLNMKHEKGTDGEEILRRLTSLTVPVFHAYGHKRSCQISYGAKWTHGVGLTDGEIMERIWAFLRKFSHITKEMTPSHRIDLLTDALYYFTKKKLDEMDIYLRVKIDNAVKVETEASVQLTAITQECKASVDDIKAWREAEKTSVGRVAKSAGSTALTWDEKYVKELLEYDTLRMQSALIRTEKVNKVPERWKVDDAKFITSNKSRQNKEKQEMLSNLHRKACDHSYAVACSKRYSAGQTLAARLTRQMKATSSSIHKAVKAYNESNFTSGELPDFITYKDVIDPEGQIYDTIQGSGLMSIQKMRCDVDTHEDVLADFQRELEQLDGSNEENEGEIEVADDDCFDDDPQ